MFGFLERGRFERSGFALYKAAVEAARTPYFYSQLGVPDTLDGRFDLVGLFACMIIRRLGKLPVKGPKLAQAVFDAMFLDMDINLREMGVGDMAIAKRVRAMWEAFHGRAIAYDGPLQAGDADALAAALARNVWRGGVAPGAADLAKIAVAHMGMLDLVEDASLIAGRLSFAAPQPASGALAA